MSKWKIAKLNNIFLIFFLAFFALSSYAQFDDVPVFEDEQYSEEYEGELEQGSYEPAEEQLIEETFQGNVYLKSDTIEEEKLQSIFGEETKFEDPFSGEKITAKEYKKIIDTDVDADVSWTLQDRNKIDEDNIFFKGQNFSLIDWENLDPIAWLDYDNWKANREFRDKNKDWKIKQRESSWDEIVGKVISCVGTCKIYRGMIPSNARHLSRIKEGDEVVTEANSYMWIFLMDGTLVRISPHTSISFNEFNVSNDRFFHYARLNKGHILWYSRVAGLVKNFHLHETDTLFLPLKLKEANIENFLRQKYQSLSEEKKQEDIYNPINATKEQTTYLNSLIGKNYKLGYKTSEVLLVLPNGTINAENAVLDVFCEAGTESYVRSRDISNNFDGENSFDPKVYLFFRGYNNKASRTLDLDTWYSISIEGRDYKKIDVPSQEIYWSEFVTKRIPTILLAREILLNRFSKQLLSKNIGYEDLAIMTGYRLWNAAREGDLIDRRFELNQRKSFLLDYTRRVETTNLRSMFKLLDKMEAAGEIAVEGFDDKYYGLAFRDYYKTISNLFTENHDVVKEYKDAQYYIWTLTNAKGK